MQRAKRLLVVCMICVLAAISISLVACNNGHDHKYDKWAHDETHHWKVCSVEGCTEKDDSTKAEHKLDADGKCECGYEKTTTPPPPAHQHTYEDGKWVDLGNGKHAKQCDDEDYTDNSTAADHTYVEGKCDKCDAVEPHTHTYTEGKWADLGNGKHAKQCDKCEYTDSTTAADHTEFDTVNTDPEEHWDECKVCGAEKADSREEHDFVTVNTNAKEHWDECECGAEKADSREEHEFVLNQGDETNHWEECECGAIDNETVDAHGFAEATEYVNLGDKHAVKCPTCGAGNVAAAEDHHFGSDYVDQEDGTCAKECAECDALDDVKEHRYVNTVFDTEEHWNACQYCGLEEAGSRDEHNYDDGDWTVIEEGANEGKHAKRCATCQAVNENNAHDANFPDEDPTYVQLAGKHAVKCADCDLADYDNAEDHELNEYVDLLDGTCAQECEVCGYKDTANALEHDYQQDKDTESHWNECSRCGLEEAESRAQHSGEMTTGDDTYHWRECETCGAAYSMVGHYVDMENWLWDNENHYHACVTCGGGRKNETQHFISWTVVDPATCTAEGFKTGKCSTSGCGYTTEAVIDVDENAHVYNMERATLCEDDLSYHKYAPSCGHNDAEPLKEKHDALGADEACSKCGYVDHRCDLGHVYDDSKGYAEECSVCGKTRPTIGLEKTLGSAFKASEGQLSKNGNGTSDTANLNSYLDSLGDKALILPAKWGNTTMTSLAVYTYIGYDNTNNISIVLPSTYTNAANYVFMDKIEKIYYEGSAMSQITVSTTNPAWNFSKIVYYCDDANVATVDNWRWVKGEPKMWTKEDIDAAYAKLPPEAYNEKAFAGIKFDTSNKITKNPTGFNGGLVVIPVYMSAYVAGSFQDVKATTIAADAFKDSANITAVVIPLSITTIEADAFANAVVPDTKLVVYYQGTEEQWRSIDLTSGNEVFSNAKFYYFDGKKPGESVYNTWHWSDTSATAFTATPVEWHEHSFNGDGDCDCGEHQDVGPSAHVHKFLVDGTWHDDCQDNDCDAVRSTVSNDVLNSGWNTSTSITSSAKCEWAKVTLNTNILVIPARTTGGADIITLGMAFGNMISATQNTFDIIIIPNTITTYNSGCIVASSSTVSHFYVELGLGDETSNYIGTTMKVNGTTASAIYSGGIKWELIHYYSEEKPSDSDHNYWHYETVEDVVVPVAW